MGLMSGTSADGIDVALVRIQEKPLRLSLEAFDIYPYEPALRNRILNAFSPRTPLLELGELNVLIAGSFAKSALRLLRKENVSAQQIDFIGSHGQTVYHQPPGAIRKPRVPFTMQLGDGSVIAQKTGILTVSDFRSADIAQGGEGAPLLPYADWRLFSHPKKARVLLNIGGIANFTFLPPKGKLSQIVAGDTGPGNVLLDAFTELGTGGKLHYDKDGRLAARGSVHEKCLRELSAMPFIRKPLPKSAEREWFGKSLARKLFPKYRNLSLADFLATACAFTAESVAAHLAHYAPRMNELLASGGGVQNKTLMKFLRAAIRKRFKEEIEFQAFDALGIPAKAKEAVSFAFLAFETLQGRPSNVPNVTGAKQACVLGKISLGREKSWTLL